MKKKKRGKHYINSKQGIDPLKAAERKVFIGVWTVAFGGLIETQGVAEELVILKKQAKSKGIRRSFDAEEQAATGVWFQAFGQVIEAIGFTKQLSPIRQQRIDGRKIAIVGNWLQAIGSAMEATGETRLLVADIEEGVLF